MQTISIQLGSAILHGGTAVRVAHCPVLKDAFGALYLETPKGGVMLPKHSLIAQGSHYHLARWFQGSPELWERLESASKLAGISA
jgi:hypothetical protein